MAYQIVESKCTACGVCAENCPASAIAFATAISVYRIREEACIDCGACESACPSGAPRPLD